MHKWVIPPASDNDVELNRQFPSGIDLNKILPDLLTQILPDFINVFIKKANEEGEKYKEFYLNFKCSFSQTDM